MTERHRLKQIALKSGGTITLGLKVDLFSLTAEDRDFVTRLVDLVREYEKPKAAKGGTDA